MKKIKTSLFRSKGDKDYEAAILGSLGFSARYIAERTGLSVGQTYYRLKLSGVHLRDYRNGVGPVVKHVMQNARPYATRGVEARIRKELTRG